MNLLLIFIVILLHKLVYSSSLNSGCLVWNDIFVKYENNSQKHINIHIFAHPRSSIIKIGFLKTPTFEPCLSLNYNFRNFTYKCRDDLKIQYQIDESPNLLIDNILHVQFRIDRSEFEEFRFFQFSHLQSRSSDVLMGLKESPFYANNNNFEIGWCDPRYLRISGRLGAQEFWSYVVIMFIYIIVIILCIYFRDYHPIKSRGVGPVAVPLLLSSSLSAEYFNTNQTTYEQNYYYDCFTSSFVLYPAALVS